MDKIYNILKKIKIKNIIILIILLVFNAYAWFVYNTRVSMDLSVHVSSWEIKFVDEQELSNFMYVAVERAYPGMNTYERTITVKNGGEIAAELEYEIRSIEIMGDKYDTMAEDSTLTSEDLENKLDEYPFKINVAIDDENLNKQNGQGTFKVTVNWPFESGDDALDTYWGNKAYEYYSLHPRTK